jgi:aspartate/methionine/tyrosine aminotransferase
MFSHRTSWKLTHNALTRAIEEAREADANLLDLTTSNPTRAGLKYDAENLLGAFSNDKALDYDPQSKGLLSAREAVAEYYRQEHDIFQLDPERIILTTSTSEAYSYIFRLLCNADDEILVPKPSYPLFEFLADLQDVRLIPYPLLYDHGWQIDFPSLYKSVTHRTRAVVVVHPNNPTGSFVRGEEVSALSGFCKEYGLAIIADEVFLDYALDGAPRTSFAKNDEVLTFALSGVSKVSGLPQMKLAWMVVNGPPDSATDAMSRLEIIADTYLSMSAPIQLAAPVLLDQRKNIQPLLLDRTRENLQELDRALLRQKSCQRLAVEGGWYTILRVPVTRSDEELSIELVQRAGVLVHPGHFFDFASEGNLVLSLITASDAFREGVKRILRHVNS